MWYENVPAHWVLFFIYFNKYYHIGLSGFLLQLNLLSKYRIIEFWLTEITCMVSD
jgi:hypothetical protein